MNLHTKRKKNSGFSLIELIIVITIMVALIAVMAPNFIKYVQKSRDAMIKDAAQTTLSVMKAEYSEGRLTGSGAIRVAADADGNIKLTFVANRGGTNTLRYVSESGVEGEEGFVQTCGAFGNGHIKSTLAYYLELDGTDEFAPVYSERTDDTGLMD